MPKMTLDSRCAVRRRRSPRTGRAARLLASALATGALAACASARNAVWVQQGSNNARLVFRVADEPNGAAPPSYFYGLAVTTCGGEHVLWAIRNGDDNAAIRPVTITYGQPPQGYYSAVGPTPLRPGCYEVTISGPASTRFTVARDGSIKAETPRAPAP
jgi:hypothetical protein